jgi:hypothetical protein
MTTTLLPPAHITPPGQGRYPAGNGRAPPTATVSAHSDHQNVDRSARHRRPDPAQGDQWAARVGLYVQPGTQLMTIVPIGTGAPSTGALITV